MTIVRTQLAYLLAGRHFCVISCLMTYVVYLAVYLLQLSTVPSCRCR